MRENMKIMVVEDDIDLSELIKMYLIPEGWEIDIFHTGKKAVESFDQNHYDLILLDLTRLLYRYYKLSNYLSIDENQM